MKRYIIAKTLNELKKEFKKDLLLHCYLLKSIWEKQKLNKSLGNKCLKSSQVESQTLSF